MSICTHGFSCAAPGAEQSEVAYGHEAAVETFAGSPLQSPAKHCAEPVAGSVAAASAAAS